MRGADGVVASAGEMERELSDLSEGERGVCDCESVVAGVLVAMEMEVDELEGDEEPRGVVVLVLRRLACSHDFHCECSR